MGYVPSMQADGVRGKLVATKRVLCLYLPFGTEWDYFMRRFFFEDNPVISAYSNPDYEDDGTWDTYVTITSLEGYVLDADLQSLSVTVHATGMVVVSCLKESHEGRLLTMATTVDHLSDPEEFGHFFK